MWFAPNQRALGLKPFSNDLIWCFAVQHALAAGGVKAAAIVGQHVGQAKKAIVASRKRAMACVRSCRPYSASQSH